MICHIPIGCVDTSQSSTTQNSDMHAPPWRLVRKFECMLSYD